MPNPPSTESVWSRLSRDLRRFIRRRVPDDHVADDLLQETFLRIHRNLASLGKANRLAPWVYQIARNVVVDYYRKRTETATAQVYDVPEDDDDSASAPGGQSCGWLGDLVDELPEKYRVAIRLSELEGLSQREVAQRLGLSLSGAKSRIQRGTSLLRGILDSCCTFEFDRRGTLLECHPHPNQTTCQDCQTDKP